MRILHISDLHLCDNMRPSFTSKRFTGWLNWKLFRGRHHNAAHLDAFLQKAITEKPDLVVVTGDLTQLGTKDETDTAMQHMEYLPQHGIPVLIVPGNHDCYMESDAALRAFQRAQQWTQDAGWDLKPLSTGVVRARSGKTEIIILQQACPTGWFMAWGALTQEDWAVLDEGPFRNRPEEPRLVFGHYPLVSARGTPFPPSRALREAPRLTAWLAAQHVRYYGCGHVHHPFEQALGTCIQVDCGSLTSQKSYADIEISDSDWHFSIQTLQ